MTAAIRKRREGGGGLTKQYYASAGNSLVKEGRLKDRLTQQESAGYAAAATKVEIAAARNGIEDYEYLRLLERKSAALGRKRSTPLRQKLLRTSKRILGDAKVIPTA